MEFEIYYLQVGLTSSSEEVWEGLRELATTVQRKHYPMAHNYEDLISEALIASYNAIMKDKENGAYRNLRSYLYTVMRNTMSNTMYHLGKDLYLEDIGDIKVECFVEEGPRVPTGRVEFVLSKMPEYYSRYRDVLYSIMSDIYRGRPPIIKEEDDKPEVEKLLALVLWSIQEGVVEGGS